ncbi:heat shock protein HslJ [Roseovarius sp. MBR-154]|jgi:heat shock protein HslJ
MRSALLLIAMSILGYCKDETISGHGGGGATWVLHSIDGTPFTARVTLSFPQEGSLAGEAPCNRYSGAQTLPYPWFRAEALGTTKRTCPDLEAETRYLRTLAAMTLVEVAGDTLLLTNEAGREMVFRAAE